MDKKLRYFYLSLEEAIYKCENSTCLYPFDHFIFKRLSDNKVYYYEEIIENGGREVFLRVPLDGQSINHSKNPLSTKLFSDSQRNPDIESYDCDFSDLFDDIDIEPAPESQKPSTSTVENPDFLEFLDDVMPSSCNDKVLDDNGINGMIDNMLRDSPLKSITPTKVEKTERSTPLPEVTLSKCIKHIEKKKNLKNYKISEKSQQTFESALKKVRTGQAQMPTMTSVKPESTIQTKLKPKEISQVASMIKSTSNFRPTELANRLKSMDISKTSSSFLRQYMQTKENQLFSDEPCNSTSGKAENIPKRSLTAVMKTAAATATATAAATSTSISSDSRTKQKDAVAPTLPKKTTKPRKSAKKEPKDSTEISEPAPKKVSKPRAKKPKKSDDNTAIESTQLQMVAEQQSNNPTTDATNGPKTKEIKLPNKKRTPPQKNTEQHSSSKDDNVQIDLESTQTTKKSRKKKTSTAVNEASIDVKEEKSTTKRPRNRKSDEHSNKTDLTAEEDPKPKRRRTKKEKINESTLMSLPILIDDTGEF